MFKQPKIRQNLGMLIIFSMTPVAAQAGGGSEIGAVSCAEDAVRKFGPGFTHVERSVRQSHNIEEFWLVDRDNTEPIIYCRYHRGDEHVVDIRAVDRLHG